jgi:hypothetical protein
MPFDAQVLKVFIASPGDVNRERRVARKVIFEWNDEHAEAERIVTLPIGWETHSFPASGDHPQHIIDAQVLEGCDLLVAIFWSRLGEKTPDAESGTVGEIEKHIQAGKQAMVYFSRKALPQGHDPDQFARVKQFEESVRGRVLYGSYASPKDFADQLKGHLLRAVRSMTKNRELKSALPEQNPHGEALSEDARRVLLKATEPGTPGTIMYGNSFPAYVYFTVNNENLVEGDGDDIRQILRWETVMTELLEARAVTPFDVSENAFQASPSSRGVLLADQLRAEQPKTPPTQLKCPICAYSRLNVEPDPSKPPALECRNPKCLGSSWHRDAKCDKCGKRPAEIGIQAVGFTTYLCEDGHPFEVRARRLHGQRNTQT